MTSTFPVLSQKLLKIDLTNPTMYAIIILHSRDSDNVFEMGAWLKGKMCVYTYMYTYRSRKSTMDTPLLLLVSDVNSY